MRFITVVAVLVLGFGGGCVTKNSTTEEDRQGVDVVFQIVVADDAELDRLEAALVEDPSCLGKAAPFVKAMREKHEDARSVLATLQANNGKPERPVVYSRAEVPGLIERMRKSHAVTFWGSLIGALGVGFSVALGIARSPLARMIPGFGPVFTALDSTLGAVEAWMQKKKQSGEAYQAADLAKILELAHTDANVGAFIDKKLGKVQELMGTDPVALIGQPAVNAAAPAPPAAPTV